MTSTSGSERTGRTAIKRPGAGIAIDRDKLVHLRTARLMTRAQLAQAMSNGPCEHCGQPYSHKPDDCPNGKEYSITPDAIAKIENGWRRPKTSTLARMCDALHCAPTDLLINPDDAARLLIPDELSPDGTTDEAVKPPARKRRKKAAPPGTAGEAIPPEVTPDISPVESQDADGLAGNGEVPRPRSRGRRKQPPADEIEVEQRESA
jgi:transcriptional regulator with XRE-family HTH domain